MCSLCFQQTFPLSRKSSPLCSLPILPYQYPGMNKVMQAAGRVIRTIRDKGVIALLDDRFLNPQCVSLFPREWGTYTVVNRYNVGQAVNAFWDRTDQACSTAGYP